MGKKPEISTSNFKSDLFDNFTDIILFIDLKGRVLYANKAVNKYGFKESDLIGESTYKLVVKKHVLQLTKEMLDLAKGKPTHGSVEIIAPKGNFFMEYKSKPIKKNGKVIALQTILRDVTEQKNAEKLLKQKLLFENILNELSMSFIDYDKELVDDVINKALETIGNYFHADRSYIFSVSGKFMSNTHEWCKKGVKPEINNLTNINLKKELPWFNKQILKLKPFVVESVAKLPSEAKLEKKHFQLQKIKSLITIPLTENKELKGFIGLDIVESENKIDKNIKDEISTISSIFNNFLKKDKIGKKLIENESRLLKSQEIGLIGTWKLDIVNDILEWTEQNYKIFGVKQGASLNLSSFLATIHPDDKEYVAKKWTEGLKSGVYNLEHRIIVKGKVKWVKEKAKILFDKKGKAINAIGITQDITEKKLFETKLIESENKFRTVYQKIPVPYQSLDSNGDLLDVNPAWLNILGYKKQDVIGKNFSEFVSSDKLNDFKSNFSNFKKTGTACDILFSMKQKNGEHILVEYNGTAEYDENGVFQRTHCIFQDITSRELSKKKLKESEEKFKTLVNKVSDIIYSYDINGNIIFVSDNIGKYGYRVKEVLGKPLSNFVHPDDLKSVMKDFEMLWKTGKVTTTEFRLKLKNGKYIFAEESGQLIYENNKPVKVVGVIRDITERKQAEEELIVSEEQLMEAQEVASIGSWSFDVKTAQPIWSEQLFKIFGIDPKKGELNYKEHKKYIHPKDWNLFNDSVANTTKTGVGYNIEIRLVQPSGNIVWVNARCKTKKEKGVVVKLIGTTQDITDKKLAEEKLKESEEQFRNMIDTVPGVVYKCDMNWTFSFASFAFKEVTGFPVSDVINNKVRSYVSLMFEDDVTRITPVLNKALKKKDKYFFSEYKLKTKTGDIKWVRDSVRIVYNKNGVAKGYEGVLSDITNIKTAEGELRKEKEFSENILKALPKGMDIVDENLNILYMNEFFLNIFGKKAIGKKCYNLYKDNKKQCGDCPLKKPIKLGERRSIITTGVAGNRTYEINHVGMNLKGKKVIMEIFRDITDQKEAENLLEASEKKYKTIIEHSDDMFYIHDTNHKLSYVSPLSKRVFGYTPEEMMVKWTTLTTKNPINDEDLKLTVKALKTGVIQKPYILEFKKKNGEIFWAEIDEAPIKNSSGKIIGIAGAYDFELLVPSTTSGETYYFYAEITG